MSWRPRLCRVGILAAMAFASGLAGATASAQIKLNARPD